MKLCLLATLATVACAGPSWPGQPPQPLDPERMACQPQAIDSGPRHLVALSQAPGYVLYLPASFTASGPDYFLSAAGVVADAFDVTLLGSDEFAPHADTAVVYIDGVPVSPAADPPSWCHMTVAGLTTYIGLGGREGYTQTTYTVTALTLLPTEQVMRMRGITHSEAMQSSLLSAVLSLARRPAT